mmetsp:Transcript_28406/g.65952  ORF Transcript_28406/g.65952 Transcript_28406/m.65952 type:complete len:152 (+) Transcript_28406:1-456(+)
MGKKCRAEPQVAHKMLRKLNGSWRLIYTTGTAKTQERARINYFPLKAVQSFNSTQDPFTISNGIFLGNFAVLQFFGNFEFVPKTRVLEFQFDEISILGFRIDLRRGVEMAGGGSKKVTKRPFFKWISADDKIATARGAGGGLALWKRVVET